MQVKAAVFSLLLVGATAAHAQDAAPTTTEIQDIEQRLSELKTKQNLSIAGMVVGGVVVVVVVVGSMVKGTLDDQDKVDREAEENGTIREAKVKFDGGLLAVGLTTLLISSYTSYSASAETNELKRKKF